MRRSWEEGRFGEAAEALMSKAFQGNVAGLAGGVLPLPLPNHHRRAVEMFCPRMIRGIGMMRCGRGVAVRCNGFGSQAGDSSDESRWWLQGDGLRYEWKWHEARSRPGLWNKGLVNERLQQAALSGSSEVWDCYESPTVPPPENGVAKGHEDDKAASPEEEFTSLAQKMPRSKMGVDLLQNGTKYRKLKNVYVILFGVDKAKTEGIYSLRSYNRVMGLHVETIICFECSEEAFRFAGLLEATMVHPPAVHTIETDELVHFCKESGYSCRVEPKGSLFMPPEFNVGITDWERSMRLREGKYKVLEEEPDMKKKSELPPFSGKPEDLPKHIQEINDSIAMEIDEARAMLERMLPKDEC